MNFWMFRMTSVFLLWFATFTPSEKVALASAFLVLIGVIGEYVVEVKAVEERTLLAKRIKRLSTALLVLGLSGDVLGIVMGQAEMALLTKEASDAATSAQRTADTLKLVKNEADDLLAKYEAAELELTALKAKSLPRRLSSKQKELLGKRVAAFAAKSIFVGCVDDGTETSDFEQDFVKAFSNPGLHFKLEYALSCSVEFGPVMGPQAPSIQVEAGSERQGDADILVKALEEIGINKKEIVTKSNPNKSLLALTIGPKAP
jgi:hypothetical protein